MRIRPLAALIPLSLALAAAPAFAEQDLEKMNGAVTAEAGREYGTVSSMNGSVTIREGATVRQAETVNGAITIEANAKVGRAETVNGGIRLEEGASAQEIDVVNGGVKLGRDARIHGDVEAVNGGVRAQPGVVVGGNVANVNGSMYFDHAEVGGKVTTTQGDITLEASTVRGGLLVEYRVTERIGVHVGYDWFRLKLSNDYRGSFEAPPETGAGTVDVAGKLTGQFKVHGPMAGVTFRF